MYAIGKHLPAWAESTGLFCLVSGNCHILGAWSWRIQGPEPSLEAVDGEHLSDVHHLVSWLNQEMRKDIHFCDDSEWAERLHQIQRLLSAACVLITGHEQRTWLGSWAMPLIQSSNSPLAALWGQWTLWVPCQLQKTKVDPWTVGYFWRLDRITAGDTNLACLRLKESDCVICCGLLHHIIHKRPLKRPAPLKVFLHSSWVFSLIESIL